MTRALRLYDGVIHGLAALAALTLTLMVVGIVVDVVLRNLGLSPVQATSALIEYGLLFATMAGAPWLVREGGHVAIRAVVGRLPERTARVVDRLTLAFCIAVLAVLSWRGFVVAFEAVERGAVDIRSIALPAWILPAMLAVGFALMATEFLRLLVRGDSYDASRAQH